MRTKAMRIIFSLDLLVLLSLISHVNYSQPAKAQSSAVTYQEPDQAETNLISSDPYLLFQDDFNDGNADGWTTTMSGTWTVENGEYIADMGPGQNRQGIAWAGDPNWVDFVLQVDVYADNGADKSIAFRNTGVIGYWINLVGNPGNHLLLGLNGDILDNAYYPNYEGIWYYITISSVGPRIRVYVNGELLVDRTAETLPGKIGLMGWTGAYGYDVIKFDNVVVRAVKPLYLPMITNP